MENTKIKEILKILEGYTVQQATKILNMVKMELETNSVVKIHK